MRQTTKLKQLLHAPKLLQAPGAYDVLSARIIAMAGFETVYMTGYGTSASVIGQPDVGFLTATEMAEQARTSCRQWTCRLSPTATRASATR